MTSSPPARRFDWSNLRLRIMSAAILAPVAVVTVWVGGVAFLLGLWIAIALLAREWASMSAPQSPIRAAAGMAAAVLVALLAGEFGWFKTAWLLIPLGGALAAIFAATRRMGDRPADEAFGALYLGAPAVALLWLRSGDSGRAWTLALLAVAWAADIAAFAAGSIIKGPKLWPRISPNKTWSGFAVGLAAAVASAEIVALWPAEPHGLPPDWAWAIGLIVGAATMAGDLCESMLKRRFGVKDSGSLIPGHGGLLDRVDGLMFATIAMAAVRLVLGFGEHS